MSEHVIKFLYLWLEKNDLLDGRKIDDDEISDCAGRLFVDAEAVGISEGDITRSWDELHRHLVEIIGRRHRAPAAKQ
ncbi:hypothetical protein [Mesorhizobium sp. CO1-1-8]|uniref:hypothetical protein n=1 Tax=Mesorhizobium sp. CO1-1-8 TaxID=2876631 RepID=UPI001CD1865C|nr:hypothetical protein [Mesorhizobium sp. CO1-1-8]MBZ9776836.1 hypothetical protein [Mesorhizobium sp. CO1-1-8]